MRRILAFLVTTVDGYYEGPNQAGCPSSRRG